MKILIVTMLMLCAGYPPVCPQGTDPECVCNVESCFWMCTP